MGMTSTSRGRRSNPWATGLAVFAAAVLLTSGLFQVLGGLAAIVNDEFLVSVRGYAFAVDATAWGWLHLLIGALCMVTGYFVFQGAVWARMTGIFLAALSATANFLWIPYYPVWAILIIALDIAIIWALSVYDPSG